jgi:hypothetical protein
MQMLLRAIAMACGLTGLGWLTGRRRAARQV